MKYVRLGALVVSTFFIANSWGNSLGRIPGIIPKDASLAPASDLFYQGKVLLPHKAKELKLSGVVADLSTLSPRSSDIWRDDGADRLFKPKKIDLNSGATVKYLEPILSRPGNFRFTGIYAASSGAKTYTFFLAKTAHNVLLRAALLKKLGYTIPSIKHLPKIKIKFDSALGVELFKTRLYTDTFGDPKRWVLDHPVDAKEIELRDVLVLESDVQYYNLALGYVPEHLIMGRRVLNSLLIPYAFTNVPESVNMFTWHAGSILSESIRMDYTESAEFSTTIDDGRWIARKIGALTKRSDFEEIVKAAALPEVVGILLTEKLISRRETLCKLFTLNCSPIPFDVKKTVGDGKILKNGKLLQLEWPEYASRFAFGDPVSPLSNSEIFSLFKSKTISNIISNLISKFNEKFMPRTDLTKKIIEKQTAKAREKFIEYLKTGVPQKTSFGAWGIPRYGTNIIVSRDIVAGSYLGTDNVVQLVDTIGVTVDGGAFIGTDGIPTPWVVSGDVKGYFTRRYSHLKPIKSMKKALNTPYRDILVPWLKRDFGKMFDPFMRADFTELGDEEKQIFVAKIMAEFNKLMEVGESMIITDSIGGKLQLNAGYKFTDIIRAEASFFASQTVISRLHIHRSSENSIQIYKDLGKMGSLGFGISLQAKIPIIKMTFKKSKGSAKTKFYELDINDKLDRNPNFLKNIIALRALLLHNSLELINVLKKPYIVKHKLAEYSRERDFFIFRKKKQKQTTRMVVIHPQGAEKRFYRKQQGKRKGKNYEAMAIDILNGILNENEDNSIALANANNGNPGDSFLGSSFSRNVAYEGEIEESAKKKGIIKKPFVNIAYSWKGWKVSYNKLKKILSQFNKKYAFNFFPKNILNTTQSLQLYQVSLNIYFYDTAMAHMVSLSDDAILKIFREHGSYKLKKSLGGLLKRVRGGNKKHLKRVMKKFIKAKNKYIKAQGKLDLKKAVRNGLKMASIAENILNLEGFLQLVGGKENIYIHSRISGFREGDESGDTPLVSNSIGEIGGEFFAGPLQAMKSRLGMTESEFFVYWMLGKI